MKQIGNLLVGKTSVNSNDLYPSATPWENIVKYQFDGDEVMLFHKTGVARFIIDPSQVEDITKLIEALMEETRKRGIPAEVDDSMVITLVSSGEYDNLLVSECPVSTVSFRVSAVTRVSSKYSKVEIFAGSKISINVPPYTDATEVINSLFNPSKHLCSSYGLDHILYKVNGCFDEEWAGL